MYLWKVDNLVEDFKSNKVTSKEELKYMLLFTIVITFVTDPIMFYEVSYRTLDIINLITLIGVSCAGIYLCFKNNSAGDDKDFMVRVICLGFPVLVRTLVVAIPIMIVTVEINSFFLNDSVMEDSEFDVSATTFLEVILTNVITFIYYYYLSIKVKETAS